MPICRKKIDDFNVHMLICSTKKSLMQCHDAIKHYVKELCNATELNVDVEASPFGKRDNNGKKDQRRPDLIIHNLTRRGSSLAVDISIANFFSQVCDSSPRPLAAAALSRETDKINKYAADCSKLNLAFHPLVMDAYGGIPPNTVQYVLSPFIHRVKNFVPPNWTAPTTKAYWY